MRLLHFAGKKCQTMMDMMPGIKATYQMGQEFAPYLDVDFLENNQYDEQNPGIILQTKNVEIKKYYDFKDSKEIDYLRDLIWYHLRKEKNIVDLPENEFKGSPLNNVTIGFNNIVKEHEKHVYPDIKVDIPESNVRSLNQVFRLNPNDVQTENTCKRLRYTECVDNYPQGSPLFGACIREVNWLCKNGYPNNKVNKHNEYATEVWTKLYNNLRNNSGYVNKQQFDDIIDAGMFYNLGNTIGKSDKPLEYFSESNNTKTYMLLFIFFVLIVIMVYYYKKN
jgi:hypothetical protein